MMNRREYIKVGGVGFAGMLAASGRTFAGDRKPPNLLYIFADQMRFSAMGCMAGVAGAGDEPKMLNTPNLNRMADDGVLFTHAFSTTPVCTPYRVGLQTGQYCNRVGYELDPKEPTIAHALKARGYSTGYIGKWHMHGSKANPKGYVEPERRVGWDFFAGHECTHKYFNTTYFVNNDRTPIPIKDGEYEPEIQTNLAVDFLKRQTGANPFCLFLSWGPPHNPYRPPLEFDTHRPEDVPLRPNVAPEYREAATENLAKYYGQVESLDAQLGRILQTLEESGQLDNTIICFTADHGDMHYSHKHEEPEYSSGYKRRPYEEAVRIPFIMRWPGELDAGTKTDMLFGSVNVMPTLLGLCGAPVPDTVQGEDLSKAILSKETGPESVFLQQTVPGNTGFGSPWRAVRTKTHLYATSGHTGNGGWILYDLENDPYQMNNLIDDPASAGIRADLDQQLTAWREKTGDDEDMQALYERGKRVAASKGSKKERRRKDEE